LKNENFRSFVDEYLEFEKEYLFKEKAVEDYRKFVKPILHNYNDLVVNNTLYFDQFKSKIVSKMNDSIERFKSPINRMIDVDLPQLITDFKIQREIELGNSNLNPSFDYEYYDNFIEMDAVKLIALTKAYEEFQDFLNLRCKDISSGQKNVFVSGIKLKNHSTLYIEELYKQLYDNDLIFVEEEEFKNHFVDKMIQKRMLWNEKAPALIFLIVNIRH
jgi:hypothetical protein